MTLRVGVIGCGLVGGRRARSASQNPRCVLKVVVDINEMKARALGEELKCAFTTDWSTVVSDPNIDAVTVCTVNSWLAPVTLAALNQGKHVLCEKPLGRNANEACKMAAAARNNGRTLKVGFTLRFHPGIRQAKELCDRGAIGPLFFVRAVYGHGGRPGYGTEWRGQRELSGGGELLDQGVHLLDLGRYFLGDLTSVAGVIPRYFWDVGDLEDNAFVLLRTRGGQVASFHTSWTQWRNQFLFELFGRDGSITIRGLGGSYGPETLTHSQRSLQSGPPEETMTVFDGPDTSWDDDWADFVDAILLRRAPAASGEDGVAVMRLVDEVYESAKLSPEAKLTTVPHSDPH